MCVIVCMAREEPFDLDLAFRKKGPGEKRHEMDANAPPWSDNGD
jgi:hypothetical protein